VLAGLSSAVQCHPRPGTTTVNTYSCVRPRRLWEVPTLGSLIYHLWARSSRMGSDSRLWYSSDPQSYWKFFASASATTEKRQHTSARMSADSHEALAYDARSAYKCGYSSQPKCGQWLVSSRHVQELTVRRREGRRCPQVKISKPMKMKHIRLRGRRIVSSSSPRVRASH
jgi:hypothetical protein